jgi:hypothetical protein
MSPALWAPSLFRCAIQRITLGNERLCCVHFEYQYCKKDLAGVALSAAA